MQRVAQHLVQDVARRRAQGTRLPQHGFFTLFRLRAPFLWHHYPGLVQVGDLDEYRAATRKLLGEYTEHYQRQRIQDDALREARAGRAAAGGIEDSLANAARCDRLDKVRIAEGSVADLDLL